MLIEDNYSVEWGFKKQLGGFLTGRCLDPSGQTKWTNVPGGPLYLNNMKLEYGTYPDDLHNGTFNIKVNL